MTALTDDRREIAETRLHALMLADARRIPGSPVYSARGIPGAPPAPTAIPTRARQVHRCLDATPRTTRDISAMLGGALAPNQVANQLRRLDALGCAQRSERTEIVYRAPVAMWIAGPKPLPPEQEA